HIPIESHSRLYRQCSPTPFTTDSGFSNLSKYLEADGGISDRLLKLAPEHGLRLRRRFGDVITNTMEYNFLTANKSESVDMFVSYQNGSQYLMTIHMPNSHTYRYLEYPVFDLCSIELLGLKLLAPCDPEPV